MTFTKDLMNRLEYLNEAARNGRLAREVMDDLEDLNEYVRMNDLRQAFLNMRFREQRNPGLKCYKKFLFCF